MGYLLAYIAALVAACAIGYQVFGVPEEESVPTVREMPTLRDY